MINSKIFSTAQGQFYEQGYQSNWHPMDTLELFKQNQKINPNEMEKWHEDSVIYRLNRYGFRTHINLDDYTYKPNTWIVLGCSHSFGIGIPYENTYTYLLEKYFGNNVINLSVPAGSLDSCYRVCKAWFPKIQPTKLIIQIPDKSRREFLYNDQILTLGAWDKEFVKFRTKIQTDVNDDHYEIKILDAIKGIIGNIQSINFNFEIYPKDKPKDKARDQSHAGIIYQYDIFEHVKDLIEKQS